MAPMKAADIIAHPAYESVEWKLPPTVSGTCTVAKERLGGPFNLYYEVHGTGPVKMVWIMGLAATHLDWKRQTKYFGHQRASEYSCLVFDNRGIGKSDKPTAYYSTSEMARDTVELITHLGWIQPDNGGEKRPIHVIGISMGGMIAQEVALLIPDKLASLTLCCTAPKLVRTVPFTEYLRQRASLFLPRHIDEDLAGMAHTLFAEGFLDQPDDANEDPKFNFPTKRERFYAGQLSKRSDPESYTKKGFFLQVLACYFHNKSDAQLKRIGDLVGRDRILLMHGTEDRMLTFKHGEMINEAIGNGIQWKVFEGSGHMLPWENEREFNKLIEDLAAKGEKIRCNL